MVFVRSGGVQGDGTDRTKTQTQIFTRFGLTWHQRIHFSDILEFQCIRNGPQNLSFCPGSFQDTFIIYSSISHQHIFSKIFPIKMKTGILVSENPEFVSGSPPGGLYFQKWPPKIYFPVIGFLEPKMGPIGAKKLKKLKKNWKTENSRNLT